MASPLKTLLVSQLFRSSVALLSSFFGHLAKCWACTPGS